MPTTYQPRHEEITGSSLSGSTGDTSRTYTLSYTGSILAHMSVKVDGAEWQINSLFTKSGDTITFVGAVYDDQEIVIDYFTESTGSGTLPGEYATTLQLNQYMGMDKIMPERTDGGSWFAEQISSSTVGSQTIFFLDKTHIIDNTLDLTYGADSASTTSRTSLTEDTHYSIDLETGKITLNATGLGAASASTLFADEYRYNDLGLTDSFLSTTIDRAEKRIDKMTMTHFADSTQDTPDYKWVSQEIHEGKGEYRRDYFTTKNPVPEVKTTLDGDHTSSVTTITVASTAGFPEAGTATIGTEQVTWTGKTTTSFTGVTRGANSSTAASHSDGDEVNWFVVEISRADEGEAVTWDTLKIDQEYHIDYDSGRVRLMKNLTENTSATTSANLLPLRNVPGRVRISHPYGYEEIPEDIVMATLMLASKDIMHLAARKAHSRGQNDFQPALVNVDDDWIDEIIMHYRAPKGEYL